MDEWEILEYFRKADSGTREKIKRGLLETEEHFSEAESSKSEPFYTGTEIRKSKQIEERFFRRLFVRDYMREPELLDKGSNKPKSLGCWLSKSEKSYLGRPTIPAEKPASVNSMSLQELLPKTDFTEVLREDLFRQALLQLILKARDWWTESKNILEFPGNLEPLSSELHKLALEIRPKITLDNIVFHYRTALYEIDSHIPFNWKGFLDVFYSLPLSDSYSAYLVERAPHVWEKRIETSNQIFDQIKSGRVYFPNNDYVDLDERQQDILKVYYQNKRNIPTLEAIKLAKINTTIPDDPEELQVWVRAHKDLNNQYRFSQIFRDKKLRNYLLKEVRRGVYRAAF